MTVSNKSLGGLLPERVWLSQKEWVMLVGGASQYFSEKADSYTEKENHIAYWFGVVSLKHFKRNGL